MRIKKVSTDDLLKMATRHGSVADVDRTWQFFERADGDVVLTQSPRLSVQLFRGQTRRYTPCFPSIARDIDHISPRLSLMPRNSCAKLIANLIRLYWFCSELDNHPAFRDWSERQGTIVQKTKIELAQHYGVPSSIMDLTESMEVALFFASHDFIDGTPYPRTEGTGILYMVNLSYLANGPDWRFRSMAIGPFERPFRQFAWSCELMIGECFECCPDLIAWEFDQDAGFSDEISRRAEAKGILFPQDPMDAVVECVKKSTVFPLSIAKSVIRNVISDPSGLPAETEESVFRMLQDAGLSFADSMPALISPLLRAELGEVWEEKREYWMSTLEAGFQLRLTKPI